MKPFLVKIGCFTLALLAILTAMEVYVENMPNIARDKHQWMLQHSNEVKTLVLGNSHNLYGIRPDLLGDGAFSLAQQSQTYRYDYYLLQHYPMKELKTIILNFDYSLLWEDFESIPKEEFQAMRYRIYMDCDIHPRLSWYGFEVMYMPLVTEKLQSLFTPRRNHWDVLGWATEYTKEARPQDWDDGKNRAEANTCYDTNIVSLNEGILRDIFDYCQERHIKVILLNTPVSATFRQYEDPRQRNINTQVLTKLLHDYPSVQYLDWEADLRFTPDDFYDSDHLNHEGTQKLTQAILCYSTH